jgi:glycosyltransferase involved in cell wall biosynthesis
MHENWVVRFLRFLERRMYTTADHIITVGEGYREDLLGKSVPPDKVSVVTNGVDPDVFMRQEPDTHLQHTLELNGEFICSYIGTVGMAAGLRVVLQAAELLRDMNRRDIRFFIVGDGAKKAALEEEAQRMGLDNVLFTGLQPKAMIPKYLSITDACLIHLRRSDVFTHVMPSKIFEAAGMAKPIIIGVPGFAERFVLSAGAGLAMEPENPQDLVNAVTRLADRRDWAKTIGEAGYRHVMAHYTRDTLAEDYLKILTQIIHGIIPDTLGHPEHGPLVPVPASEFRCTAIEAVAHPTASTTRDKSHDGQEAIRAVAP